MKPAFSSPASVFAAFVLALLAAMLLAAAASPWVQALLSGWQVFPLHRVFSRLTMLGVVLITAWLLLRHDLWHRAVLGYAGPAPRFLRHLLAGLAIGVGLMIVAIVPLLLLDARALDARAPADISGWSALALKGLGSGLAVALIEETYFRGAMQGALQRMGALRAALFGVPVLYAAVHFLGRAASVPHDEVDALSGFVALQGFFSGFRAPLAIADAFLALWCVGVLLALVRHRWRDVGGCIGLHAGFVAVITVFRKSSAPVADSHWSFLVGSFDGLLGIWIAALAGLCCVMLWRSTPANGPARNAR